MSSAGDSAAVLADSFEERGFKADIEKERGDDWLLVIDEGYAILRLCSDGTMSVVYEPSRGWLGEHLRKIDWPPPVQPKIDMKRELGLWVRTGHQDANNTMDVQEIRDDLGSRATVAQIHDYLLEDKSLRDFEGALEFPEGTTEAERRELLDAWATGWAEMAHAAVRDNIEEQAEDRLFREPPGGMLDPGWWIIMRHENHRGPYETHDEALAAARRIEEDDQDRPRWVGREIYRDE